MKTAFLLTLLQVHLSCFGAFVFTGGNGEDLTVTLTEDLAIPLNAPSDGNSLSLDFVLEDVYSVPQPQQGFFPLTDYGAAGSIKATLLYQDGGVLIGTDYALWGTLGIELGIIDPTDFIGTIQFQYDHLPNAQPGDVLLIRAGTIVIPRFLGIVRPDLAVTTIQVTNGSTGNPFSAAWPVEAVVVTTDADEDGVPNDADECPNTPAGSLVNAQGCSIDQRVPCLGPSSGGVWRNHGRYVSAVASMVDEFVADGTLTAEQGKQLVAAAAQSDCGKGVE